MAYTAQQIYDAGSQLAQSGMSNEQIFAEAAKYGLSPTDLAAAYQTARPDLFAQPGEIAPVAEAALGQIGQGNFSMDSLNTLNADPRYQALSDMTQYAQSFLPDPGASIHTANNLPAEYRAPAASGGYGGYGGVMPAAPGGGGSAPSPTPAVTPGATGSYQAGGSQNPYLAGSPGGMFSDYYGGYQASPWLSATADELGRRTQQGLGDAFNSIRSNAVGVGGLGGSRQGVAEGVATGRAMDSLQGNLAGLYGTDWNNSQNRGLSQYGLDQNFYTAQRGQDLTQLGLGAEIYDRGVQGGWTPLNQASGIYNTAAGNNVTGTTGSQQGGGWQGLLGGALSGATLGRQMNWW